MPRRQSESVRSSSSRSEDADNSADLGLPEELLTGPANEGPVLRALGQIAAGATEEEAARSLTWKDFEGFCAQLLRASGYSVRENIYLSHPRSQIDLVATGPLFVISLDCKHWKRAPSRSVLEGFAMTQLRRSRFLRRTLHDKRPIISAILSLSEPAGSFVEGVAVVPLRTLRDFLDTVESYSSLLEMS